MDDLVRLAELIKDRNKVARDIANLIGRPAQIGHVGEYIASRVFGIVLEESASQKGLDGRFTQGQLAGHSVNVKWYAEQEGLLDITPDALPDFYLVLIGPRTGTFSSRGKIRPWIIESVYLFESGPLINTLQSRSVKIGVATSVIQRLWTEAEIYPNQHNVQLVLSGEQRKMLGLFH